MMVIMNLKSLLLSIYDGYQDSQITRLDADTREYAIEYRINVFARPALAGLVCVFEFIF